MPNINPDILIWARQTAGLEQEEASQKLRINAARGKTPVERLAAYEAGEKLPSRALLKKMAKQYRRPLITFYLSAPPHTGERGQDFRRLPADHSGESEALVDALIRDIQARQSILRSALEDEDEATPLPFVGSMKMSDGVESMVDAMRNAIPLDLAEFRRQRSLNDAFMLLRGAVESLGVFVLLVGDLGSYHTAISLKTFRGFALADDVAPFIVINDRDAKGAWSFTLIHELAHIWLGQTGISNIHAERQVEKFCNAVAGEFLLPAAELRGLEISAAMPDEVKLKQVSRFAQARNVSSSMVAYNLYLTGVIQKETWQRLSNEFRELWQAHKDEERSRARESEGGPSYYVIRRHRVGPNLISLVQRMMHTGALTTTKAGKVLGVKSTNVQKLLEANQSNSTSRAA